METVCYDEVAAAYREGLLNRLRGFRVGPAFLDAWVDDEDLVTAARALFEAAAEHGIAALRLRFVAAPLGDVRRVAAAVAALGETSLDPQTTGAEVTVRFGASRADDRAALRDARAVESVVYVADDGDRAAPREDWSLADAYLTAARARTIRHEGSPGETFDGAVALVSTLGPVTLRGWVTPDASRVIAARFDGAREGAAAVLDAVCEAVEGVPLREALDHGVSQAELALRDRDGPPPVRGVVLPENASPAFAAALGLLRGWLDGWAARGLPLPQESRYHRGVSDAWRSLGADAQRARVNEVLDGRASELGGARCARVVQSERVILKLDAGLPSAVRAAALMRAERWLKSQLDAGLYVQTEERNDANPLRRL